MKKHTLIEIAQVFFKLGCFAFGGPAAHIAMMESEIIEKRKWMTHEKFLDIIGVTNLIPGPNSTEMTMHCGYERGGTLGLIVAGLCFILPATAITGIFAWFYMQYGQLPEVEPFIFGIKPAVLAIIASAIFKLGKKALKNWQLGILGGLTLIACLLGVNEIIALLVTGLVGTLVFYFLNKNTSKLTSFVPLFILQIANNTPDISGFKVFLVFLKVGAILYGSGYVLFAYLDAELVQKLEWLTRQELMDAIAVGQFTPGPVLSTATFIGYQLYGFWGALGATLGVFLPSFIFVLLLNPFIEKIRNIAVLRYFLDAVNIAAVAIMVAVLYNMGLETLTDWRAISIAIISTGLTFGFKKINAMHIVGGSSILGYLLHLI